MNEFNEKTGMDKKSGFDITEILTILSKRKWLIILPLILVTAVTAAGTFLITPEYESSVIIYIGNPVKLSVDLQRLLGGNIREGYRSSSDRQLELRSLQNEITSSPFIKQLAQKLKLDQDPNLDNKALKVQASQPNLTLDQIKLDLLVANLKEKIGVGFVGNDQIEIKVQSTDPFRARDMAQNLGEIFIEEKMKQELGSIRMSQDFSYEQLAKYEKDLNDKIDARTRFEREFMKVQIDDPVASDENRRAINSEISSANIDIELKKDEERELLARLSALTNKKFELNESSNLKRLKKELETHMSSIGDLMLKHTWSAPEILNHKTRMYSLIGDIEDEHRVLVNKQFDSYDKDTRETLANLFNVQFELETLYSRNNQLKLALDDLRAKVDRVPEYQARLDQLDREIVAARDLRDKFKEQQESSQISQALLRESKYQVIEPAKVPMEPFKPQRKKIVMLGFLLGLAIGGAATLLTEILDKSFRKVDEIEAALGFPVIGVVPHIDSLKKLKVK
nr:hypothetical protein [candidate division Zixibacteria bacterium]